MKNNSKLQKDVQDAILWQPLLKAAEIGVTAIDGVITLSGIVDSYTKKMEAENAAKNVTGVKAVVENIEIVLKDSLREKTDNEIAGEIVHAFKWNWQIPDEKVKVSVENGWITLEGRLEWNYQKAAAMESVKNLLGVKGISNKITIKSATEDAVEKMDIESAIRRNNKINDDEIQVDVDGTNVVLSGTVTSWYQKDEAEKIAWNAPGVSTVENNLVVEYDYALMD